MRLRDTFKYFCSYCWVCFTVLMMCWGFFAGLTVFSLVHEDMAGAVLAGFLTAFAGSVTAFCSYTEANSHYRRGE